MDMLAHLAALGRAAEELGRAMADDGHLTDHQVQAIPQLDRLDVSSRTAAGDPARRSVCAAPVDRHSTKSTLWRPS
jgi:hypothetical protein